MSTLKYDWIELNYDLSGIILFAHDLIRKPVSTFRDHALGEPPHDAGDAVDRNLRAVGNAPRGIEYAEHRGDAALARQRSKMRGRAAKLGDDAADTRQDVAQRRAGNARDQNIARRHAAEFAFAVHHHGAARAPADPGGMAIEARMSEPDCVRHRCRLHVQR